MREVLAVVAAVMICSVALPAAAGPEATITVFNGEGNRLNAYDADTFEHQTVIASAADDPQGGADINAQICFDPDHLDDDPATPNYFIAGEDTGQDSGATVAGGQGWGYFELTGDSVGDFGWKQIGKLDPTYNNTEDNPENYGCGFLSDGRLVTGDVGDQQPQSGANGQLVMWFPPFDRTDVPYCKIAVTIPTAGQIHVDADDRVFIGSQRPDFFDPGNPGGIYLYEGDWPTSDDAAGGCGRTDGTGAPMVDDGRITRSVFINAGHPFLATPSAVVPSPAGGFYASSVFDGKISEFDADGTFVRSILIPPPGNPPYETGTPFGLGIDRNGTLYYADIGIVLGPPPGPGNGNGSVRRITFDEAGNPSAPEKLADGLAFPDGIGILEIPVAAAAPEDPPAPGAPQPDPTALPTTGGGLALLGLVLAAGVARRRSA